MKEILEVKRLSYIHLVDHNKQGQMKVKLSRVFIFLSGLFCESIRVLKEELCY